MRSTFSFFGRVNGLPPGRTKTTRLSSSGLGPFWRLDTHYEGRYRDWTGTFANRNAFTKWGDIYLELVEPGLGEGNAKEWLRTRGEGIFHLGYAVDDMRRRPEGVECVFETFGGRLANGDPAVIHLDTVDQLGYYVELSDRAMVQKLNATIDAQMAAQLASPT